MFSFVIFSFFFLTLKGCSVIFPTENYISRVQLLKDSTSNVLLTMQEIINPLPVETISYCGIYSLDTKEIIECLEDCNSEETYNFMSPSIQEIFDVKYITLDGEVNDTVLVYSYIYEYNLINRLLTLKNLVVLPVITYWSNEDTLYILSAENEISYHSSVELTMIHFNSGFDNPSDITVNTLDNLDFGYTEFGSQIVFYSELGVISFEVPCCLCYGTTSFKILYDSNISWKIVGFTKLGYDVKFDLRSKFGYKHALGIGKTFTVYDLDGNNVITTVHSPDLVNNKCLS